MGDLWAKAWDSLKLPSSLVKCDVPYLNSVIFLSVLHIQLRPGISQAHICIYIACFDLQKFPSCCSWSSDKPQNLCLTLFTKGCSQQITRIKRYEYYTRYNNPSKVRQQNRVSSWRHLFACKDTSVKAVVRFMISELKMNICHLVKTLWALHQAELDSAKCTITKPTGTGSPGRFVFIMHLCLQWLCTVLYLSEKQVCDGVSERKGKRAKLLGAGKGSYSTK